VIRFLREKFRGNLDRKHRRLSAEFQQVRASENRLAKRRKKIVAQMALVGVMRGKRCQDT